jgi:hypothetical protein
MGPRAHVDEGNDRADELAKEETESLDWADHQYRIRNRKTNDSQK